MLSHSRSKGPVVSPVPVPIACHDVPFHMMMLRLLTPAAPLNFPPTYTFPLLSKAMSRTSETLGWVTPPARVFHCAPSHIAMSLAAMPSMLEKLPPIHVRPSGSTTTTFTTPVTPG